MRKILFVTFLLSTLSSLAIAKLAKSDDWMVTSFNDAFFIQNLKDKKIRFPVDVQSGHPKFQGMETDSKSGLQLLVYYAGSAGTYEIVEMTRVVVYNPKNKKFLGDFPYSFKSSDPRKKYHQTTFTFKKNSFTVVNKTEDLKKTIKF